MTHQHRLRTENVLAYLADNNISRRRLAIDAGLSPSTLYKTLDGKHQPGLDMVCGLRHATKMSFDDICECIHPDAA